MAGLNPLTKLFLVLAFSIFVSMSGWLTPLIGLALVFLDASLSRKNLFRILWKMKVMLITALMILVFSRLAEEGWMEAVRKTAVFLAVISASALFVETTDLTELSAALGKLLVPILGKRAWSFASSVMMTMALFPLIFSAATEMVRARAARGGSFIAHPLKNLTEYTVSLMRLLFQKILIFQDALYSRFYSPTVERTSPSYGRRDHLVFLLILLSLTLALLWKRIF